MKKIYLIILLCCLSVGTFAARNTNITGGGTAAGNITCSATNTVIYSFTLSQYGTTASATLNGITFTTTGSYVAADLTNIKLWYNTTNNFATATNITGGTLTTGLGPGTLSFTGLTQVLTSSGSATASTAIPYYFFITVTTPATTAGGHTIAVSAIPASTTNVDMSAGTIGGAGATAGGVQTITPLGITGTTSVCAGSSTTLADATASGTWTSATTSVATVNSSGVVFGVAAGTSLISYTVSGCRATTTVTVNAAPAAITPGATTTICLGTATTFANTTAGGTWTVTAGSGTATVTTGGVVTGLTAGTVTLNYTTTGCTPVTKSLTVIASPTAVSATASPNPVCSGSTLTLIGAATGATIFAWSGPSFSASTQNTSLTSSAGSAGIYTFIATNGSGCSTSAVTAAVAVSTPPAAITGGTSVCAGASITLSNTSAGGTWSTTAGTGSVTITAGGVVTGLTTGSATIIYTTPGCTAATLPFTINGVSAITFTGSSSAVCSGTGTTITASGATTYTWSPSTGLSATTGASVFANPTSPTLYTITGSTAGCSLSTTRLVALATTPSITPTATSPTTCIGGTSNLSGAASYPGSSSTTYAYMSIPYSSLATTGTAGPTGDDAATNATIPFSFKFYGVNYTTLRICTNGWVSFNAGAASTTFTNYAIPSTTLASTWGTGGIALGLHDFTGSANIKYSTQGTAPNRKFVVSYNATADLSCGGTNTIQLILYETTNLIDIMVGSLTGTCNNTIGLQNVAGTDGVAVVNGLAGPLTAYQNTGYRFYPYAFTYAWTPSTALSASTGSSVTATVTAPITYTVSATDTGSGCIGVATIHEDTGSVTGTMTGPPSVCTATSPTLLLTGPAGGTGYYHINSGSALTITFDGTGRYSLTPPTITGTTTYKLDSVRSGMCSTILTGQTVTVAIVCPCTPVYASSPTNTYAMTNFTLAGYGSTAINDNGVAAAAGYANRSGVVSQIQLQQGGTYSGVVTCNYNYYMYTQVWVDYNDNGVFESTESISGIIGNSVCGTVYTFPFTATVPITATLGVHLMRVRNVYNSSYCTTAPSIDPCLSTSGGYTHYYGETWDYAAKVVAAPACTGTPSAGTATTDLLYACSSDNMNFATTGYTIATAMNFQWQRSNAGSGVWSNISGATNTTLAYSGQTVSSDYRCGLTCVASGLTGYTNTLTVTQSPCYCTPSYSSSTNSYYMTNFTVTGDLAATINDNGPAGTAFYSNRSGFVGALSFTQGGSYSGSISTSYSYYNNIQIYIDFNNDGTFSSSERVTGVLGDPTGGCLTATSYSFTLNVPITSATGTHRMRVRYVNTLSCTYPSYVDPCSIGDGVSNYYYGKTWDYVVTVNAAPPCSGTPTAGTAAASPSTGCGLYTSTLTLSGYSIASGITLQWQKAASSSGPWTNISGATNTTYTASISATTYFRCVVTCSVGGSANSSTATCANTLTYTVATVPFLESFETAWLSTCSTIDQPNANWISSPTSGDNSWRRTGTSLANSTWSSVGGVYSPLFSIGARSARFHCYDDPNLSGYLDLHINLGAAGANYQINYDYINAGSGYLKLLLSLDNGATFTQLDNVGSASVWTPRMVTAMGYGCTDAILRFEGHGYYEAGDLGLDSVYVKLLPNCTGSPTAGSATASTGMTCSTGPVTLNLSGATVGVSAITYQWQKSAYATGAWSDISGATTLSYTFTGQTFATDYRCKVTCGATSLYDISNIVSVQQGPCACTPVYSYTTGDAAEAMDNFALTGYAGSSINDAGVAADAGYADRSGSVATINLQQGGSYSGVMHMNDDYDLDGVVWIDFNDNGTFESSEMITPVFGYSGSAMRNFPFTATIPLTATTGLHRMRARSVYQYASSTPPSLIDPCNSSLTISGTTYVYYYGETWDYLANIVALPACSGTPATPTAVANVAYACSTTSISLSQGTATAAGLSYQWQRADSSTGVWANIAGATNLAYTFTGQTISSDYRCRLTCPASGLVSYTSIKSITQGPCYCTPVYVNSTNANAYAMTNFTVSGFNGTSINDTGTLALAGFADRTGSVPVLTLLQSGSYAGTVTWNYNYYMYTQVWIDFNDDGTFATGEYVTPIIGTAVCGTGYSATFTMTIPAAATLGNHRMRVRNVYNTSYCTTAPSIDPCLSNSGGYDHSYGETWDYEVKIAKPVITETGTLANFGDVIVGNSSASQNFVIAGATLNPLSGNIVVTPPTGYQVTTDTTTTWTSAAMNVAYTGGSLANTTIYARFRPVAGGVSSGNIVLSATGATSVNVAVAGTGYNPVITSTPTSLTSFGNVLVGTSSSSQSYSVSATGLYPAAGNLTVRAPRNFKVASTVGGTYDSTFTIPYTGGALSATTVYVKCLPDTTGALSGNIATSGGSSITLSNVAVTATGVIPGLVVTPPSINFGSQLLGSSTSMSFNLSGTFLTGFPANITVTSPGTAFLVSNDNATWGATTTIAYTSATLASTPIYVQFNPTVTGAQTSLINFTGGGVVTASPVDTAKGNGANYCGLPLNQPTGVACLSPTPTGGSLTLTPDATAPDGYVLVSTLYPNTFSGTFTDGVTPTVGTVIGSGPGAGTVIGYYTTTPPFTLSGLLSNTQYNITVVPYNSSVACPGSPFYNGTGALNSQITTCPGVPGTPTASAVTSSGFTIGWSAPAGGASTYFVNVYAAGVPISGSPFSSATTSYVVSGLNMNTNYTFNVVANNASCSGLTSATGNQTTTCANPSISSTPTTAATCSGTTAVFTASGAGVGGTYTWSPSTALSSTVGATVTATSTISRIYTVTGTNLFGCFSTATAAVNVNTVSAISVSPSTSSICPGSSVTLSAVVSSGATVTLLSNNFTTLTGSVGGLWVITNTAGVANSYFKIRNSPGYSSATTGDGSAYIQAAPDAGGSGVTTTTKFTSPSFSTVGYTSAALQFNQYFVMYSGDITAAIEYSINGTTWTTLQNYLGASSGSSTWTLGTPTFSIPLPAAAMGQATVSIRWNYNSVYGNYWAVDNVVVKADVPSTSVPTWSPTTGLYTNAALTVPYTGATASTVYAAPSTATTYTASVGSCAPMGTANIGVTTPPTAYGVTGGTGCSSTGIAIGVANSDVGVNYQLLLNGTPTGTPVTGSGSSISFGLKTATGVYSVMGTLGSTACNTMMTGSDTIFASPAAYVLAGATTCASIGSSITLSNSASTVSYQLYNGVATSGSLLSGTGTSLNFGTLTTAGAYTALATGVGGCTTNMTGSVRVNPNPVAYNVTGGNGCTSTGVTIGLDNSDTGNSYQLKLGATNVSLLAGTATSLSYGLRTAAGTYTVLATNLATGCTTTMTGSSIITTTPSVTNLTGGDGCTATGITLGLSSTNAAVSYQLYNGASAVGSPVTGTGISLSFGLQSAAGTYTAIGTAGICSTNMAGSSTITTNPAVFNVTGGSGCSGTGITVGIDGSETTANYTLKLLPSTVVSTVSGTSTSLSFTPVAASGTYIVTATAGPASCLSTMNGSDTIRTTPVITLGAISNICQPYPSGVVGVAFTTGAGSVSSFGIDWNSAANLSGFVDVPGAVVTGSSISLTLPDSTTVGSFDASVNVFNGPCISSAYPVHIIVYAHPAVAHATPVNPCVNDATNIYFTGTDSATVDYLLDGSANSFTFSGTTYTINTGSLTGAHTYIIQNAHNPVCSTSIYDTITVNPIPMTWQGGTPGHETEWSMATNWTCGFQPRVTDNVTIGSAAPTPIITLADAAITNNLTLNGAAALSIDSGAIVSVKGTLINNSYVSGSGRIVLNNSTPQMIKGRGVVDNFELANTSGASIDTAAHLVIGNTLYVTSGTLRTNDSLELASLDTIITGRIAPLSYDSAISGKVTVDQFIQGGYRRYRFWSHPFSDVISLSQIENYIDITGAGGTANGFTYTASGAPSVFWLDPVTGNSSLPYDPGWKPFTRINNAATGTNLFYPGQGIRLFMRGAKGEGLGYLGYIGGYTPSPATIKMIGHVNQGPVTITLARGTTDTANQEYNMVGNPYPSAVDIGTILYNAKQANQINGAAFYLWDPAVGGGGAYETVPLGIGSALPYKLQANTSFQVRAHHNGATLSFTETDKVAKGNNNLLRSPADYFVLDVYDAAYNKYDKLRLQFTDAATGDNNNDLDATKLMNPNFSFYSLSSEGRKMAIDARPYAADKVIPLGVNSNYEQEFIIRADNAGAPQGGVVYLHDKLLNKFVAMTPGAEYKFAISKDKATQGDNRFELSLKPAEATAAAVKGLNVSMSPNPTTDDVKITFSSGIKEQVTVRITDLTGITIYSKDLGLQQNGAVSIPLSSFASGIYMVELTQGLQKVTKKLVKE